MVVDPAAAIINLPALLHLQEHTGHQVLEILQGRAVGRVDSCKVNLQQVLDFTVVVPVVALPAYEALRVLLLLPTPLAASL